MFTPNEIRQAVIGTIELMSGNPAGLQRFDFSLTGFARSFGVAFLLALPLVISTAAGWQFLQEMPSLVQAGAVSASAYALKNILTFIALWLGYPLIVALIARNMGLSATLVPFIVTYNWSSLVAIVPQTLVELLYLGRLVSAMNYGALSYLVFGFTLYLAVQVTRLSARTTTATTIGLVVLAYVYALLVDTIGARLIGI